METQYIAVEKQSRFSGLITKVVETAENQAKEWSRSRLRKGLRHGQRKYTGFIDAIMGSSQMDYGVGDILRGTVEKPIVVQNHQIGTERVAVKRPNDNYKIGRYMAIAGRLVKSGVDSGDIDATLTGARIYEWLGQGNRQSVRNRVQKAYAKAKQIGIQYGVPLSVSHDRSMAVMSSDLRYGIENYLEKNQGKLMGVE